jgi:hypothetical protein
MNKKFVYQVGNNKKDSQYTYNLTFRGVRATIFAAEKQ